MRRISLSVVLVCLLALTAAMAQVSINTPSPLPAGASGSPYSQALSASGGAIPYQWTLSGGALPPGLGMNPDGSIGGTPTAAGTFTFTAKVVDSQGGNTIKEYSLTVNAASVTPKITTDSPLAEATVDTNFTVTFAATGGRAPYSWNAALRALPPGLTLASNGTLSGTPTAQGTFSFTVNVTDSLNVTATKDFSIVIKPTSR
jgi:hypothetical protein